MKRILLLSLMLSLVGAFSALAQRTVSGTVTDETGSTVPGVNVVLKGTTTGSTTDLDGNYRLSVPEEGGTLVFSFIGLAQQEIEIGARSVIDVMMASDVQQLTEVVVTAVGIERDKKALGYSIQSVDSDEITQSRETNIVNALNGKVAGVQITSSSGAAGASAYIKIRGNASLTQNNQPLFVVDGIPINNQSFQTEGGTAGVSQSNRAMDMNPQDIESVTVLKGPAATALYGIRASNGAIVITTKKGKVGENKTTVTFNSTYMIDEVNRTIPLQQKYSQGSNGVYRGPETGDRHSWGAPISDLVYDNETNPDYIWDPRGQLVPAVDGDTRPRAQAFDNVDEFFQKGSNFSNNISVSSSGNTGAFYMSIGRTDQESVIPNTSYDRTSVKFTGTVKLAKNLDASGSVTYVKTDRIAAQQGSNISGLMLGLYRTPATFRNADGYQFADGTQRSYRGLSTSGNSEGYPSAIYDNPLWVINKNPYTEEVDRYLTWLQLNYKPTDWIKLTYRAGNDSYTDSRVQVFEKGSGANNLGRVINDEYFVRELNQDIQASAFRTFGDFDFEVLLGNNLYSYNFQNVFVVGDQFGSLDFPDLSNAASIPTRDDSYSQRQLAAIYGDVRLSWNETVFLNLTGRNEWSSTLPKDNNAFFYPSVSLGLLFTELIGENNILPYGKIRASYASVGNDAPVYSTQTLYTRGSIFSPSSSDGIEFPFNGVSGFGQSSTLGNATIVPEKNNTLEFGAELRFLQNRVSVDATYYIQRSEDQIIQAVPVAGSSGFTGVTLNAGEITNKGIELMVNVTPVQVGDFSWDITGNFTRNRNEVVRLADGVSEIGLAGFTGITSNIVAGYAYGTFFGSDWERDANGKVMIEDDPSSPSYGYPIVDSEEKVIGDPNPDFLLGIRNSFSYKGFRLSALLDIRKGGDMWNGTRGALITMGTDKATEIRGTTTVFEGVKASTGEANDISVPLDETWFKGNGGGFGNQAAQFVESTSWIRLRDVTFSYDFPKSMLENTPFQGISVGVTGRNLWLLTEYSGIDPETNLTGASNGFGLEYFNMPNTKSYGVNLNITF